MTSGEGYFYCILLLIGQWMIFLSNVVGRVLRCENWSYFNWDNTTGIYIFIGIYQYCRPPALLFKVIALGKPALIWLCRSLCMYIMYLYVGLHIKTFIFRPLRELCLRHTAKSFLRNVTTYQYLLFVILATILALLSVFFYSFKHAKKITAWKKISALPKTAYKTQKHDMNCILWIF